MHSPFLRFGHSGAAAAARSGRRRWRNGVGQRRRHLRGLCDGLDQPPAPLGRRHALELLPANRVRSGTSYVECCISLYS